ncbi:zinc finger protein 180-like isoform X2 [Artemia franciscana]|uniref:zinc finger protein 180-like isoform X2 n=1 Tax=Artemia franciscana TaxID=6661 RepID=UPI0032DBBE90
MKHEYDLLAGSSGISADCKPSSGHLKLESHSGEDKELEDPLSNDHKSLFGFHFISLPMEGSNLVNCFQDISTELEPNCDPLKQELNVNVDKPKDESTNDDKRIFPLFSMKHEYDLLAGSSGISADCKPSSSHLKLESHSGEDKDNPRSQTVKKPFRCDICRKCFPTNYRLIVHKRNHTGGKLIQCDICEKGFNQKSNLSAHQVTDTGEKRFKCDICDKTFLWKSSLSSIK